MELYNLSTDVSSLRNCISAALMKTEKTILIFNEMDLSSLTTGDFVAEPKKFSNKIISDQQQLKELSLDILESSKRVFLFYADSAEMPSKSAFKDALEHVLRKHSLSAA